MLQSSWLAVMLACVKTKTLSVRMSDELHQRVKIAAASQGIPMQEWVQDAIAVRLLRHNSNPKGKSK
jgi:predicted DNA binding CopG/RHH family protein